MNDLTLKTNADDENSVVSGSGQLCLSYSQSNSNFYLIQL